jgi:SAM-dependent methyltransferase
MSKPCAEGAAQPPAPKARPNQEPCADGGRSNHEQGLPADHAAFDISDEADVQALLSAEERHFWHRARNRYIAKRLGRLGLTSGARILELGSGAGCVAAHLAAIGFEVTGVEGHQALIDVAKRRAPGVRFLCRDLRDAISDVAAESFDAVGLFDVIEHFDDPSALLARAATSVRRGGFVVGTVPALMALWSRIDQQSGHKTRYSTAGLAELLGRVSSTAFIEVVPFFRTLIPLLWLQRRLVTRHPGRAASVANSRVPAWPINTALYTLVQLEQALPVFADARSIPGASLWFALQRS